MEIKKSRLSPGAKIVWEKIGEEQRRIIQKDYPFREEGNEAIRELSGRGVTKSILIELTGLSHAQIARIRKKKAQIINNEPTIIDLPLKGPVKVFEHSIIVIP